MSSPSSNLIHPEVRVGHIHLKVADLERSVRFYCDVLGFEVTVRLGDSAAFLSAGGYHHHVGLKLGEQRGFAGAIGEHRPLPCGFSLPDETRAGRGPAAGDGSGDPIGRSLRSRRE